MAESYPFPNPDHEVPVLLGDWFNGDAQEIMEDFLARGNDPEISNSFLINGQPGDLHPCSAQDTFRLKVESGKTYLLRVVNAVMNNIMFFKIANHNVTVVGTDAAYTKPLRSDYIAISPGQTMDLLLVADQPPSHYYMAFRAYASGGDFDNTTTTGIVEYVGNYTAPASPALPSFPPFNSTAASHNFTTQLRSLANRKVRVPIKYPVDVPKNVTDILLFTLSINLRQCPNDSCEGPFSERLMASVNNVTLQLPRTDFLQAYYWRISGVYTNDFPDNPAIPYNYTQETIPRDLARPQNGTSVNILDFNATVELVFQGTNLVGGIDHPMHLHGYSFYVVGSGFGNFNRTRDQPNYNLVDPPLMETIAVPRNGWTAIRFKANNPGVWFMHCHFERHVSWGMGMVFIVRDGAGPNETMLPPPPDMPLC
ncbi:laccase [Salvia divinorum]|uniref:Laccase n=1 Tax=Salvia divinorum TaxID=28513 RepID=A0ABD1FXJ6_SALDI